MSARNQNQRAMKRTTKNTTDNLGGGVMPRELFEEFYQQLQEEAMLLQMIRTVELGRQQTAIPKIGVGERLMREQPEGQSAGDAEEANTGAVELEPVKTTLPWELTTESVEDTVDDVAEILLGKYQTQFAVDAEDLAWNGDEAVEGTEPDSEFIGINNGYFEIARGNHNDDRLGATEMPSYDHEGGGVETNLFNESSLTIEQKYLRTDPVFFTSRRNVQRYYNNLVDRNDGLGVAVLRGDEDVTPFGYDIVGLTTMPDDTALFTNPQNLIWGLRRDVEIDVLEESDDIQDRDLFAKYMLRARHDYQIEDLQAGVIIENVL